MPELPEVENSRRQLEKHALRRRIVALHPADDDKVLVDGPAEVVAACEGRSVAAVRRKGKHVWLELAAATAGESATSLCFHQGMTGAFVVRGAAEDGVEYQDFKVDAAAWPPRHTKLRLVLDDGGEVAFTNSRRFGRVRVIPRALNSGEAPVAGLGWDALTERPSEDDFVRDLTERLGESKKAVKSLLLDQGFAAGIGNWIGDEVLYHAGVHPATPTRNLTEIARRNIYRSLAAVIDTSTAREVNACSAKFPQHWLFHYRWTKKAKGSKDCDGRAISFLSVGGRTSAVVGAQQKKSGWKELLSLRAIGGEAGGRAEGGVEEGAGGEAAAQRTTRSRRKRARAVGSAAVKAVAKAVRRRR